jgi:hypothetical protein
VDEQRESFLMRASGTAHPTRDCHHRADHRDCETDVRSASELHDKPDDEGERTQDECREPPRNVHELSLPPSSPRVR